MPELRGGNILKTFPFKGLKIYEKINKIYSREKKNGGSCNPFVNRKSRHSFQSMTKGPKKVKRLQYKIIEKYAVCLEL
jgi:hypothetical protein